MSLKTLSVSVSVCLFFVLYVCLVLTKWKWEFVLPCLQRRADLGSFQVSYLDFCAQVFCPAWVKLAFYFLHPQGRKVFKYCFPPREKFLTKSLAMKARRDFLFHLPHHIFPLDKHVYINPSWQRTRWVFSKFKQNSAFHILSLSW